MSHGTDLRLNAFRNPKGPEVFQSVVFENQVWQEDPFDVESVHREAREVFERALARAVTPSDHHRGQILLLKGEAGSGKTHLMRAFRTSTHQRHLGYFSYMQMNTVSTNYDRYILHNILESLDKPYCAPTINRTGLMLLSMALTDYPDAVQPEDIWRLQEADLTPAELAELVHRIGDQIEHVPAFATIDFQLIRALVYLQRNDPRFKARVLRFLRGESMTVRDRELIGGLEPRNGDDHQTAVISSIGELIWQTEQKALIICLDQMENIRDLDDPAGRFVRAVSSAVSLTDQIPNAIVILSCLEDIYDEFRPKMTQSFVDRIEQIDPLPVTLRGERTLEDLNEIVGRRLQYLYEVQGVTWHEDEPVYPFPETFIRDLRGLRTRTALARCAQWQHQEGPAAEAGAGTGVEAGSGKTGHLAPSDETLMAASAEAVLGIEQRWNDYRLAHTAAVPDADRELGGLLAWAIGEASLEAPFGHRFETVRASLANGVEVLDVTVLQAAGGVRELLRLGICNRDARDDGLLAQVETLAAHANGAIPVLVRSTEFPMQPNSRVTRQLGAFLKAGGRRSVIEDSDWRAMLALRDFLTAEAAAEGLDAWRREEMPLLRLKPLQDILRPPSPTNPELAVEPPTDPAESDAAGSPGAFPIGSVISISRNTATVIATDLTRHAMFVGAADSCKTSLALAIVENLLMQGTPAIVVDRRGDLAGYADPASWTRPLADAERAARRSRLMSRIDVALYTPGRGAGRPRPVPRLPPHLTSLTGADRLNALRRVTNGLAAMVGYRDRNPTDRVCRQILGAAVEIAASSAPEQATLHSLVRLLQEEDAALVNTLGELDPRHFQRVKADLETLRLQRGPVFDLEGEAIDVERLLAIGPHARPGRTRLSVICTAGLGDDLAVQFWVAHLLQELDRLRHLVDPGTGPRGVVVLDDAELYLPATARPPTREPLEALLRRARNAGLALLLTTEKPKELDPACREPITSWFVGRMETVSDLHRFKPLLELGPPDMAARLAAQMRGEFHLIKDHEVVSFRAELPLIAPMALPEETLLRLAAATKAGG